MSITRLPVSSCPECGRVMDAAGTLSADDDATPNPGDFTVCIECSTVVYFDADFTLKRVTDEMKAHLTPEERAELEHVQRTMARYHEWRAKRDR